MSEKKKKIFEYKNIYTREFFFSYQEAKLIVPTCIIIYNIMYNILRHMQTIIEPKTICSPDNR